MARFADAWNVADVTVREAAHRDEVLRRWCDQANPGMDRRVRTVPATEIAEQVPATWPSIASGT